MLRVYGLALMIVATACNLQVGEPTPFPTPDAPQITFQEPINNAFVIEGDEVEFLILAEDPGSGIARVELLVDDQFVEESEPEISPTVPIFTVRMNWQAVGPGLHSVTAIAYRSDGIGSRPVTINVMVIHADE